MSEEAKKAKKDKRSETSKANMKKALEARKNKFEKRKQERETYTIESSSESEDSESDNEIVIKSRKKGGKIKKQEKEINDDVRTELDELRQAVLQMNKKQNKATKKRERKQKIIQILPSTPAQVQQTKQPELDAIKKRILLQF